MKKVITHITNRITLISHPASPSNPSVIFIALTILMVIKKVRIGKNIQIFIFPAIGRKFT